MEIYSRTVRYKATMSKHFVTITVLIIFLLIQACHGKPRLRKNNNINTINHHKDSAQCNLVDNAARIVPDTNSHPLVKSYVEQFLNNGGKEQLLIITIDTEQKKSAKIHYWFKSENGNWSSTYQDDLVLRNKASVADSISGKLSEIVQTIPHGAYTISCISPPLHDSHFFFYYSNSFDVKTSIEFSVSSSNMLSSEDREKLNYLMKSANFIFRHRP